MLKSILLTALVGYLTIVFLIYLFQRNLMYLPGAERGDPAAHGVPEMSVVSIAAADGVATVSWYARPRSKGRVVLLFHGNAGTIADRAFKARHFLDAGYGVLLVGYRGFANNPGAPSEAGFYSDAAAAASWLVGEGVPPGDWIVYGESLGSGLAVEVARNQHISSAAVGAVVLEAPFTSMADAAAHHYPWLPARWLVRDRYDSLSKIGDIGAPLLIVHGTEDRTVPVELGRRLHEAAIEPKRAIWLNGAGHVNLYDFDIVPAMLDWIENTRPPS